MYPLSEHFTSNEFECPCCGKLIVDSGLIEVLEIARYHFDKPIIIKSGYRCPRRNADPKVKGAKDSQHLYGRAADIRIPGVSPDVVWHYFINLYPDRFGIGRYNTITHIDVRNGCGRWDFRDRGNV